MAKSQIIKDIANDNVSLESSLKRAIIIATDLGNEKIRKLLSLELYGYSKEDELPEYRKLDGQIKIDYTAGYTIDRWRIADSNGVVNVLSKSVEFGTKNKYNNPTQKRPNNNKIVTRTKFKMRFFPVFFILVF